MSWWLPEGVRRYAAATWTPPFEADLPSDLASFLAGVSPWRAARRRLMRELSLVLHGQRALQRLRIDPGVRRVLWIHQGTPQVGDSLMDLAARQLLADRFERLDLLTDAHLLPLYQADHLFTAVAARPQDLPGGYDLILLHSASSRGTRDKFRFFRDVPFVHLHGVYTGPEFNRTLFGFHRVAALLAQAPAEAEIRARARTVMWHSAQDEAAIEAADLPAGPLLAVAVGGVRDWRTCSRWGEVLERLARRPQGCPPVVLVGAANGLEMRDRLVAALPGVRFVDRVDRHSLPEVHALLQRCALVLAADGGLLHVAQSADVPVLGLFAGIIDPAFRVTAANRTRWLHGPERVDDIDPDRVAALAGEMLAESGADVAQGGAPASMPSRRA